MLPVISDGPSIIFMEPFEAYVWAHALIEMLPIISDGPSNFSKGPSETY